ncbi:hypothetical protein Tco_0369355 [Tanacetum coccineum]
MSSRIGGAATLSPSSFGKRYRSSYETSSSSSTSPTLSGRKRYSETKREREDEKRGEKSSLITVHGLGYESWFSDESQGLEMRDLVRERRAPEGSAAAVSSSRSVLEQEGVERISAYRQPTLITWVDPEVDRVYTDVPAYAPPAAPFKTPRHFLDGRSVPYQSGVVKDEIFSQRYRFKSLEREQERTAVMFGALWRPVLALEAWAGHQAAMQRELQDMRGCVAALE